MGQITIRGLSVDLPALDEVTELDRISSPGDLTGVVSDFEFSGVRVPAVELKDVTLAVGRIGKVRAGKTSLTGAHVIGSMPLSPRSGPAGCLKCLDDPARRCGFPPILVAMATKIGGKGGHEPSSRPPSP